MKLAYVDVTGHYEACGLAIRAIRRGAFVLVDPLADDEYRVYARVEQKHVLGPVVTVVDVDPTL